MLRSQLFFDFTFCVTRIHFISNLVLESLKFKKLLDLQEKSSETLNE